MRCGACGLMRIMRYTAYGPMRCGPTHRHSSMLARRCVGRFGVTTLQHCQVADSRQHHILELIPICPIDDGRMRTVCNHHSKILQHSRIITQSHTHTHTRSACNHHSKILQHRRIITRSHTHDACDPFCNHHFKIQHHRIRIATHTRIRRMPPPRNTANKKIAQFRTHYFTNDFSYVSTLKSAQA